MRWARSFDGLWPINNQWRKYKLAVLLINNCCRKSSAIFGRLFAITRVKFLFYSYLGRARAKTEAFYIIRYPLIANELRAEDVRERPLRLCLNVNTLQYISCRDCWMHEHPWGRSRGISRKLSPPASLEVGRAQSRFVSSGATDIDFRPDKVRLIADRLLIQ